MQVPSLSLLPMQALLRAPPSSPVESHPGMNVAHFICFQEPNGYLLLHLVATAFGQC